MVLKLVDGMLHAHAGGVEHSISQNGFKVGTESLMCFMKDSEERFDPCQRASS